tara:strand:- start:67318 stop:67707 length:390 start_codon:yes stop_codon:yes gene_type:complete
MTPLIGVLLLVFAAACDPGFELQGTVHDEKGKPVSGATIHVSCGDNGIAVAETTSDALGRFLGRAIGWRPLDCTVDASASGYEAFSEPIALFCTKKPDHLKTACLKVSGMIRLKRSLPARPSSPASDAS